MTDWDVSLDDHEPGSATMALINGVVWLLSIPGSLYARLSNHNSTTGDDAGQEADGSERAFHDGLNITGAEHNHG